MLKKAQTILQGVMILVGTIILQYLVVTLLLVIVEITVDMKSNVAIKIYEVLSNDMEAICMIVYGILMTVIFGYWYWKRSNAHTKFRNKMNKNYFIGILMVVPGLQLICGIITYLIFNFSFFNKEYEILIDELPEEISMLMYLYMFLVGPIAEEVVFRGLIFGVLKKHYSVCSAILIQAILFGVYHMNFYQACYVIIIGLVLACVMQLTNNLIYPISLHVLFNIYGNYEEALLRKINIGSKEETIVVLLIVVFLVMGAGIFIYEKRRQDFIEGVKEIPSNKRQFELKE